MHAPTESECPVHCPVCESEIELRKGAKALHRIIRCLACGARLHVLSVRPIRVQVFTTSGLSFIND